MDADTALSIMESLDEAEELLRRMRLHDGDAGHGALDRNRALLNAARCRLDLVHAMGEMDGAGAASLRMAPA